MWSCVSCEMWTSYKMGWKGLLTKVFPVLKDDKGNWVRNPQVITDRSIDNGRDRYGEDTRQARS